MNDKIKSAAVSDRSHAPIVYFEGVPAVAHINGIIAVTLAAELHNAGLDRPDVVKEPIVTAYLRTNIVGAMQLRDWLDKALLLANPPDSAVKN